MFSFYKVVISFSPVSACDQGCNRMSVENFVPVYFVGWFWERGAVSSQELTLTQKGYKSANYC
jgi:hypothetical protein